MLEPGYGGFWRRAFAYGIDKIILNVIVAVLFLIGMLALGLSLPAHSFGRGSDLLDGVPGGRFLFTYYLMTLLIDMVYFTWFHGATGRTPGKSLLRLRVVRSNGYPVTFGVAFLRWVGYLVSAAVFCLGFLWIAFDRRKQGWHDKIADTVVQKIP